MSHSNLSDHLVTFARWRHIPSLLAQSIQLAVTRELQYVACGYDAGKISASCLVCNVHSICLSTANPRNERCRNTQTDGWCINSGVDFNGMDLSSKGQRSVDVITHGMESTHCWSTQTDGWCINSGVDLNGMDLSSKGQRSVDVITHGMESTHCWRDGL